MTNKNFFLANWNNIYKEDDEYNYKLYFLTKFHKNNLSSFIKCRKITLNFGFKDFKFDKKQMVIYFLFLELICNQKCILTTSRKNLINLRIKKGAVTGCKVTLRHTNRDFFLFNLSLALPRLEIFKGLSFKTKSIKYNSFSTKIKNLFIFYMLEFEFRNNLVAIDLAFNFSTFNDKEKQFFFTFFRIPLNCL